MIRKCNWPQGGRKSRKVISKVTVKEQAVQTEAKLAEDVAATNNLS